MDAPLVNWNLVDRFHAVNGEKYPNYVKLINQVSILAGRKFIYEKNVASCILEIKILNPQSCPQLDQ